MQRQSTLFDEDKQDLPDVKPPKSESSDFEHIAQVLRRLFEEWEGHRTRRARLEAAMNGPYDPDLSLSLDACLANEEATSDEITTTLNACEGQS